ncbi:MAG TPA: serine hydrolase [Candidatus Humimicrobiaceae bacterium]|nr:serine hydrolase [Candidatus Humimicrobiaceae bacterium]
MKSKIFFFSLFLFFLLSPFTAKGAKVSQEQILQQIEIIKQEITLLRSLLSNFQAANQGAKITAHSYLAVNLSSDSVLIEQNSKRPYPLASVTKLMTAVISFEELDLDQEIILTEEMLKPYGHSPSLYLGLSVSAENLVKASLIQSTNDAAESLSYFVGKDKFVAFMNQKAKELNMTNTVFYDPHGLNPANQSSAQDLAKLLRYIYENHPDILDISRSNNFWLPDPTGKLLKFRNLNAFYPFSTFIGGKAGSLPEARETFASIFKVKDNVVAIIILYSNNHRADTFAILKRLQ